MAKNKTISRLTYYVKGLGFVLKTGLLGFVDHRYRGRFFRILFNADLYERTPKLTRVPFTEFAKRDIVVKLSYIESEEWQVSSFELAVICSLAKTYEPNKVFEFGTFDGRTTLNIFNNCEKAVLNTIDLPPDDQRLVHNKVAGQLIQQNKDRIDLSRLKQLYGNSLTYDFSALHSTQDFIFIDADHSYKGAKSDTLNALSMLEGREGVIVWHDYGTFPGVTRAAEETQDQIISPVKMRWIANTTFAILATEPGQPLNLKS